MCIGARDGSHIPIRGSYGNRKLLWCFKGFYSLVLQIVAKGCFRVLLFTSESLITAVNSITMACCILHNICIFREVTFRYEWILSRKHIHFQKNNEEDDVDIIQRNSAAGNDAKAVRNALTNFFEAQM